MITNSRYLYLWSIVVQGREFEITILHDGTMTWQEPAAIHRAGGKQFTSDLISGDEKSRRRVGNLFGEFQLTSPGDPTALDQLRSAGSLSEDEALPEGMEDFFDRIFFKQFWDHVNPNLPDKLTQ